MMLLNIAMADAYAAGFEFADAEEILSLNTLKTYRPHNLDGNIGGMYTDDTQMTIAVAELLLNEETWDRTTIAKYFFNAFKRDERKTYSPGFYQILKDSTTHLEMMKKLSTDSVRNGSTMRSVPLGLLKSIPELLNKAALQSSVTHDTHEAIVSSQAIALAAHYFIYNLGPKKELGSFIFEHTQELFNDCKTTPVECNAIDTVDAVLSIIKKSNSLSETLLNSVSLGGDTDSTASIACGLAACSKEFIQDPPPFLFRDLENSSYGRDYLINLDLQLKQKFTDSVTA